MSCVVPTLCRARAASGLSYRDRQLHLTVLEPWRTRGDLAAFLQRRSCSLLSVYSVAKITLCYSRCLQVSPGLCTGMVTCCFLELTLASLCQLAEYIAGETIMTLQHYLSSACPPPLRLRCCHHLDYIMFEQKTEAAHCF